MTQIIVQPSSFKGAFSPESLTTYVMAGFLILTALGDAWLLFLASAIAGVAGLLIIRKILSWRDVLALVVGAAIAMAVAYWFSL